MVSFLRAALTGAAFFLALGGIATPLRFAVGVELPLSGIDGAEGLRMRDAVILAADDERSRGTEVSLLSALGATAVQNPHQDEGSDNDADVAEGPAVVAGLAAKGVHVVVGPLRSSVARAEESALARAHSVVISGTATAPSDIGSRIFKLAPSDRQLAAAAFAWMRAHYGGRVCVLDDGTAKARQQAAAFLSIDKRARRATLGERVAECVRNADAVYAAALAADPVFCSAQTARRAGITALVQAMALRGFDPESFARAGALWRAEPAPIQRTAAITAVAARYHARAVVAATDSALRFYAATQIAVSAARADGDPKALLSTRPFATILGTVRFSDRGEIRAPAIVIRRVN